jgi:hypothetical protein
MGRYFKTEEIQEMDTLLNWMAEKEGYALQRGNRWKVVAFISICLNMWLSYPVIMGWFA